MRRIAAAGLLASFLALATPTAAFAQHQNHCHYGWDNWGYNYRGSHYHYGSWRYDHGPENCPGESSTAAEKRPSAVPVAPPAGPSHASLTLKRASSPPRARASTLNAGRGGPSAWTWGSSAVGLRCGER